jgi:hypothetical protein
MVNPKDIYDIQKHQNIGEINSEKSQEKGVGKIELPVDDISWMREEAKRKAQNKEERRKRLGLIAA